jgi:solute carrier family 29 (equilibrative nucleoside transporter), member 1/2/3
MTLTKSNSIEINVPKDPYNFIYFIIFFLGLSGHLPWNAILTAQPYFKARLIDSSFGTEFTAHFAIIFKALKLAVFTAVSIAGIKINNKLWVGGSAIGNVLIFTIFTSMVQPGGDGLSANSFYLITLTLVIAAGLFLALFECGMYSILGTFPSHLTQSFMAGNAIGGILAALNLIINYYSAASNIYSSTKTYFVISTLVFLLSAFSFIVFLCTDYFKYYQKRLALYTVISQVSPHAAKKLEQSHSNSNSFEPKELLKKPSNQPKTKRFEDSIELIKTLWSSNLALFIVGFVNLTIFPALVSVTESTEAKSKNVSPFQGDLFVPLAFLIVSAADFAGKMFVSLEFVRKLDRLPFTAMSISRILLIPLFLLGNIHIKGRPLILPNILASDTIFFSLLTFAFISGSYITTIIMVTAPKKLDITEQSRATVLLCSAGLLGVFGGSVFSLFLKLFLRLFTK